MISIILPLYNKVPFIKRAIDSVLAQTITDWELVVIDDGSTDESPDLVSAYSDRRIRLVKQANSGSAVARNKGAELATQDMLAFLDADDYWAPTHLENLQQLFDEFPHASLYGTAYFGVGGDGVARESKFRNPNIGPDRLLIADYFADVVEFGHVVFTSSVAINKSTFQAIGGFPIGVKSGEDTLTWARLACLGEVAFSKMATSFYNLPPVDLANRQKFLRRPLIPDYVASELSKLRTTTPKFKTSLSRYLAHWHRIRAMMFLELNERLNSFSELWKAIRFDGLKAKDFVCCLLLVLPQAMRAYALANIRKMRGRV